MRREPFDVSSSPNEADVLHHLHHKNRILQGVLWVGAVVLLGMTAAQAYIVTRPAPAPVTFAVDQRNGDVWRVVSDEPMTYSERMLKGQITEYIQSCETYVYDGLVLFYDRCVLMSGPDRRAQYEATYSGPKARQDEWRRDRTIMVDREGKTTGMPLTIELRSSNTAYVWFTTVEQPTAGGQPTYRKWGATINFGTLRHAKMAERDALTNYTLFEVTSYAKELLP